MIYLKRKAFNALERALEHKSVLLLGPRQTGKTTLMEHFKSDWSITFADPRVRLRYEKNPGLLIDEVSALSKDHLLFVVIDEVQKVPAIMDSVQYLIDKKISKFVLTGSSARKLKRDGDINLLPGRVIPIHLDALMIEEIPVPDCNLNDLLMYGSLPEILLTKDQAQKEKLLESYVITYLEEEIRAEAIVRNLGSFARFLELAAGEAGYLVNMSKLSQEIGVAGTTIESYYQILEDCLIVERVEPITQSKTRHRLSRAVKYLFFDLGVRRMAAREGKRPPLKYLGHLFEQFVGIELIRLSRLMSERTRIRYWRDLNGPEVDWIIEKPDALIPIEVKWTDSPSINDTKHLEIFLNEYKNAEQAYVVCRTPNRMQLTDRIHAIPWSELKLCFSENE